MKTLRFGPGAAPCVALVWPFLAKEGQVSSWFIMGIPMGDTRCPALVIALGVALVASLVSPWWRPWC